MTDRRVVVTGVGAVTALGNDLAATLEALERGDSASAPATHFGAGGFREPQAAEVKGFLPRAHFSAPKALKLTNRVTQFAVAAASMALETAAWPRATHADGLGVVVGTSASDLQVPDLARALGSDPTGRATSDIPYFADRILSRLHPFWLLVNLPNMTSAHVAIQCDARGPNSTIMTDWVAGIQAIGEAFEWIRGGEARAVLAGGADSGVVPFAYASYEQGGVFGSGKSRPDGCRFVPGEGAALVLLEEHSAAVARGARVLAEVHGYGTTSQPLTTAARCGGALAAAMRIALDQATWAPSDITAVVNASVHAEPYRAVEGAALTQTLGERRAHVSTREFTSRLGHALAAAGPIDVALTIAGAAPGPQGRMVSSAIGYSGQAASLAFSIDRDVPEHAA